MATKKPAKKTASAKTSKTTEKVEKKVAAKKTSVVKAIVKAPVEKPVEKVAEKPVAKAPVKVVVEKAAAKPKLSSEPYFYASGKRKTAIARVRLYPKSSGGIFTINQKTLEQYFPTNLQQQVVTAALRMTTTLGKFDVSVLLAGGGPSSQADAVRHGISRALLTFDPLLRPTLKHAGFLTRDARMKERKKPGLKRARRAPQFSKR